VGNIIYIFHAKLFFSKWNGVVCVLVLVGPHEVMRRVFLLHISKCFKMCPVLFVTFQEVAK